MLADKGTDNEGHHKTSPGRAEGYGGNAWDSLLVQPTHMNKEPAKPSEKLPAAGCTPVTSCTYILTSDVRKGEQCRLRVSDETGKFCNYLKKTNMRLTKVMLQRKPDQGP